MVSLEQVHTPVFCRRLLDRRGGFLFEVHIFWSNLVDNIIFQDVPTSNRYIHSSLKGIILAGGFDFLFLRIL
jgi:hypothetical protein